MWIYRVTLQGHGAKDKRTMSFPFAVDYALLEQATGAATSLKSALVAATKAFVSKETLTYVISEDNQVPTDASADTYEELAVSCYLNLTTVAEKLATLAVPAPEDSMFLEDAQTLDPADALVQAYIAEIESLVLVSDGEQLQSDGRTNGAVKSGWKRSRARSFKA